MDFKELITNKHMLKNLSDLGYTKALDIQVEALPIALAKKDILAQAKTGSGKTVAFGLPLLLSINDVKDLNIKAIILAPTRELATQVSGELRKLARFKENIKILTLCGGAPLKVQLSSLRHGAHIIVATPGRVLDLISKDALNLEKMETLVLDEADKMLQMGFISDIKHIIDFMPKKRQTMLFSATFDEEVLALSKEIQTNRIEITIKDFEQRIEERFFHFNNLALENIIKAYQPHTCIVFCNTKIKCKELEDELRSKGYNALSINSDLEQVDRDETLLMFENKSCTFLVATDLASRGLDISDVDLVINYDMPRNKETYTHRIGRTGRVDKSGLAISLVTNKLDYLDVDIEDINALEIKNKKPYNASYQTLCINGGKKDKLRAGDILGALVKEIGLEAKCIGKIKVNPLYSYIAIERKYVKDAYEGLNRKNIKKRNYKVWQL